MYVMAASGLLGQQFPERKHHTIKVKYKSEENWKKKSHNGQIGSAEECTRILQDEDNP